MKIGHQLLGMGTTVLMGVLALPWSVDGAPSVFYEGLYDGRHANELNLAGILPEVTGTLIVDLPDYQAASLAVGRRITVGDPINREFVIVSEDLQSFRVLLQLADPSQ